MKLCVACHGCLVFPLNSVYVSGDMGPLARSISRRSCLKDVDCDAAMLWVDWSCWDSSHLLAIDAVLVTTCSWLITGRPSVVPYIGTRPVSWFRYLFTHQYDAECDSASILVFFFCRLMISVGKDCLPKQYKAESGSTVCWESRFSAA